MLSVDVFNAHRTWKARTNDVVRYAKRVFRTTGVKNARVAIVFVDSRYSRRMNERYLKHDYATDVISFQLEIGSVLEGEVYVNLDRARAQAKEYGVSIKSEVSRLVIHGVLHLVGYDDSTTKNARRMKIEEDQQVQYWFH